MRLYVQWTRANPQGWEPVEITKDPDWRNLPKKPEPVGGEVIDDAPGWVYALNVQGVVFSAQDHYAVQYVNLENALRVTVWNDDPVDYAPDEFKAMEWILPVPVPDDGRGRGRANTVQRMTLWTDNTALRDVYQQARTTGGLVTINPWAAFNPPGQNNTKHGIWIPDALSDQHQALQTPLSWRDWLPAG